MEFHELANLFPMLDESDLKELAADIHEHGLREPIWLYEGKILDGRNRYCACLSVGVDPQYRTYAGDEPTAFVISTNLKRRHLTYDQRVGLALKVLPMLEAEARQRMLAGKAPDPVANSQQGNGRSVVQAAKQTGVGQRAVSEIKAAAEQQPSLVEDLISGKATVRDVRKETSRQKRSEKMRPTAPAAPEVTELPQRYAVIYADPPWRYEHVISHSRAVENQYPTMTLEEICALPVREITTSAAVLFMWATSPKLKESMRVLEAWGFDYRTCAVWTKDKIGPGYYFRQQHELLLVAVKGEPVTPREEHRPPSIIQAPRLDHSAKPAEVYDVIERMYPEFPKVELFCRSPRPGWAAWGNQC